MVMTITADVINCSKEHSHLYALLNAQSRNTDRLKVFSRSRIIDIGADDFKRIFGVEYLSSPQFDGKLPPDFFSGMEEARENQEIEDELYYGNLILSDAAKKVEEQMNIRINRCLGNDDFWEHMNATDFRYLYGNQIAGKKTAPVYLGAVREVLCDEKFDAAGYGLFSCEDIAKGQFIGEATGKIERVAPGSCPDNGYMYIYRDNSPEFIEILNCLNMSNALRYVNHSYDDNVISVSTFYGDKYVTFMIAKKDIAKDDQILINYGEEYWCTLGVTPLEFS